MFTCKIDNLQFNTEKEFHSHIRSCHRIKIERYYTEYEPKRDLLTNELIDFKNPEFYVSSLFNNRDNIVEYFKKHSNDKINLTNTTRKCIELRAKAKNLIYSPSTFECRTSILPSPYLCKYFNIDFNNISKELNLINRYDYNLDLYFNDNIQLEILKDTREQSPLTFSSKIIDTKLDCGDYLCKNNYNGFVVERKSLQDLIGTHSGGYERFIKEIERAKELNTYIVVICESTLEELINFNKFPEYRKIKAQPTFITKRIRSIYEKYDHIQYGFCQGRVKATQIIEKLFRLDNNIKDIDLQFMIDCERI